MTDTEAMWAGYREAVYKTKEPLPADQETECSLAFYAGIHGAIWKLSDIATAAKSEEDGANEIERWRKEVVAESAKVNATRA